MGMKLVGVLFGVTVLLMVGCAPAPTPTPTIAERDADVSPFPTPPGEPTPTERPPSRFDVGDYVCDDSICGTIIDKDWSESRQEWAYTIKTATGGYSTWESYFRRVE